MSFSQSSTLKLNGPATPASSQTEFPPRVTIPGGTPMMQLTAGSNSCVSPESMPPISSLTVKPLASTVPTMTSSLPGQSIPVSSRALNLIASTL